MAHSDSNAPRPPSEIAAALEKLDENFGALFHSLKQHDPEQSPNFYPRISVNIRANADLKNVIEAVADGYKELLFEQAPLVFKKDRTAEDEKALQSNIKKLQQYNIRNFAAIIEAIHPSPLFDTIYLSEVTSRKAGAILGNIISIVTEAFNRAFKPADKLFPGSEIFVPFNPEDFAIGSITRSVGR